MVFFKAPTPYTVAELKDLVIKATTPEDKMLYRRLLEQINEALAEHQATSSYSSTIQGDLDLATEHYFS